MSWVECTLHPLALHLHLKRRSRRSAHKFQSGCRRKQVPTYMGVRILLKYLTSHWKYSWRTVDYLTSRWNRRIHEVDFGPPDMYHLFWSYVSIGFSKFVQIIDVLLNIYMITNWNSSADIGKSLYMGDDGQMPYYDHIGTYSKRTRWRWHHIRRAWPCKMMDKRPHFGSVHWCL